MGAKTKGQRVRAEGKGFAVLYDDFVRKNIAEELFRDLEGLCVADHGRSGIGFQKSRDGGGMVGLHMRNDEIGGFFVPQRGLYVVQPFVRPALVRGIHDRDFFVENDVRIVTYSFRDDILTFKKVYRFVVRSYVFYAFGKFFHVKTPFVRLYFTEKV